MSDLVMFLRARLDEDEAAARSAHPGPWAVEDGCFVVRGDAWCIGSGGRMDDAVAEVEDGAEAERAANAAHIARHDPARVLAEVAAKRALIDTAARIGEVMDGEWGCAHTAADILAGARHRDGEGPEPLPLDCEGPKELARVLGPLAAVYVDHLDYQQDWTP